MPSSTGHRECGKEQADAWRAALDPGCELWEAVLWPKPAPLRRLTQRCFASWARVACSGCGLRAALRCRFCPVSALLRSAGGAAPWHGNVRSKYDIFTAALAAEVRGLQACGREHAAPAAAALAPVSLAAVPNFACQAMVMRPCIDLLVMVKSPCGCHRASCNNVGQPQEWCTAADCLKMRLSACRLAGAGRAQQVRPAPGRVGRAGGSARRRARRGPARGAVRAPAPARCARARNRAARRAHRCSAGADLSVGQVCLLALGAVPLGVRCSCAHVQKQCTHSACSKASACCDIYCVIYCYMKRLNSIKIQLR